MRRLRKVILGLLWLVPFVYGLAAVSLPFFILRRISFSAPTYYPEERMGIAYRILYYAVQVVLILLALSPIAICVASAGTVIQYHRRKLSTRYWAIASGIMFLAAAAPLIVAEGCFAYFEIYHADRIDYNGYPHSSLWGVPLLGLIHLAVGVLILLAFKPRESVSELFSAETCPAKIKGDGTTSLSYLLTIVAAMGALMAIDSQFHKWGRQQGLPQTSGFLLNQLIFFGALFIVVAAHEMGHIAAGLSVGMKLLSVRIGPFHMEIKDGRWRPVLPNSWRCIFQGGVQIVPPSPQEYRKSHAIWTAAAGPLASFVTSGIALLTLLAAKDSFYEAVWELPGCIASISLVLFLANLIPLREASAYSDGARIYQILKGNVTEDFRRVVAMVMATKVTPTRPRDYDISLIEKTASETSLGPEITPFLHLVACDYYFDQGRMGEARAALSKAEAIAGELKPAKENCGAIVLRAVCVAQNREMAKTWWERGLQARLSDPKADIRFAMLAHLIVENRIAEAEEAWKREFERTNRLPETGERAFDLHYLNCLRRLMDEARAGNSEYSTQSAVHDASLAEVQLNVR